MSLTRTIRCALSAEVLFDIEVDERHENFLTTDEFLAEYFSGHFESALRGSIARAPFQNVDVDVIAHVESKITPTPDTEEY